MNGQGTRAMPALAARLVLLNLAAIATSLGGAALTAAVRHPDGRSFESLLVAAAGWALLGVLVWLQLIVAAVGIEALSRGQVRATGWVGTPLLLRRALLAACGTVVLTASAVAGPAQAGTPAPGPTSASTSGPVSPGPVSPSPVSPNPAAPSADQSAAPPSVASTPASSPTEALPAPERPTGGARLAPSTSPPPSHRHLAPSTSTERPEQTRPAPRPARVVPPTAPGGPDTVLVRPGDTLWDLAAACLPLSAGLAEVAAATEALYDANRDQLSDPDLIRPGQRLRLPAPAPHHPPRQEPR